MYENFKPLRKSLNQELFWILSNMFVSFVTTIIASVVIDANYFENAVLTIVTTLIYIILGMVLLVASATFTTDSEKNHKFDNFKSKLYTNIRIHSSYVPTLMMIFMFATTLMLHYTLDVDTSKDETMFVLVTVVVMIAYLYDLLATECRKAIINVKRNYTVQLTESKLFDESNESNKLNDYLNEIALIDFSSKESYLFNGNVEHESVKVTTELSFVLKSHSYNILSAIDSRETPSVISKFDKKSFNESDLDDFERKVTVEIESTEQVSDRNESDFDYPDSDESDESVNVETEQKVKVKIESTEEQEFNQTDNDFDYLDSDVSDESDESDESVETLVTSELTDDIDHNKSQVSHQSETLELT